MAPSSPPPPSRPVAAALSRPGLRRAGRRWLSAGGLALLAVLLTGWPGRAGEQVGLAVAVRPEATAQPAGRDAQALRVGTAVSAHDRFRTGERGRIDLVFRDGSAITIGPNAELTLDSYVFDDDTDAGELAVSVAKGLFRFIGGRISKQRAVRFRTPTALIGIRGGMALIDVPAETRASGAAAQQQAPELNATFLYGIDLTVETDTGRQRMTRPGFAIQTRPDGALAAPARAGQAALDRATRALQ